MCDVLWQQFNIWLCTLQIHKWKHHPDFVVVYGFAHFLQVLLLLIDTSTYGYSYEYYSPWVGTENKEMAYKVSYISYFIFGLNLVSLCS